MKHLSSSHNYLDPALDTPDLSSNRSALRILTFKNQFSSSPNHSPKKAMIIFRSLNPQICDTNAEDGSCSVFTVKCDQPEPS